MADEDDDDPIDNGDKIDWKARYMNQREKTRSERKRADEAVKQIDALKPKADAHEDLTKRLAERDAELAIERSGRQFDRAVTSKGITDPEAIDLVQMQYNRLDAKGRPDPADWIEGLTKDAEKTPKWLSPYLPKATEQTTTTEQTQQTQQAATQQQNTTQQRTMPDPNRTAVQTGTASGGWVPTQADRARAHELARRGDRTLFDRIQAADGFAPMGPLVGGGQGNTT